MCPNVSFCYKKRKQLHFEDYITAEIWLHHGGISSFYTIGCGSTYSDACLQATAQCLKRLKAEEITFFERSRVWERTLDFALAIASLRLPAHVGVEIFDWCEFYSQKALVYSRERITEISKRQKVFLQTYVYNCAVERIFPVSNTLFLDYFNRNKSLNLTQMSMHDKL